jgi:hypothetical protein
MDNLVAYSLSMVEHYQQLREILQRLQSSEYTLNKGKHVQAASDIT